MQITYVMNLSQLQNPIGFEIGLGENAQRLFSLKIMVAVSKTAVLKQLQYWRNSNEVHRD
jgi:hypothetical protein